MAVDDWLVIVVVKVLRNTTVLNWWCMFQRRCTGHLK